MIDTRLAMAYNVIARRSDARHDGQRIRLQGQNSFFLGVGLAQAPVTRMSLIRPDRLPK